MPNHANLTLVAAVVLLTACAGETITPPPGPSVARAHDAAAPVRPLDGRCTTTFRFLAPEAGQAPNVQRLQIDGTCQLSHLGRTTFSAVQTVTFGATGSNITNVGTYTAANGDVLRATYSATGTFPDASGNVCFSGTETYAGGTGRFTDAMGTSQLAGCASVVTSTGAYELEGTISYGRSAVTD